MTEPAMSFAADWRWLPVDVGADPRMWADRAAASVVAQATTADEQVRRQAFADKLFVLAEPLHRLRPTLAFVILTGPTTPFAAAEVIVGDLPAELEVGSPAELVPFVTFPPDQRVGEARVVIVRTASGPAARVQQSRVLTVDGERLVMEQVVYVWHVAGQHALVMLSCVAGDVRDLAEVLPTLDELAAGFHADSDVNGLAR